MVKIRKKIKKEISKEVTSHGNYTMVVRNTKIKGGPEPRYVVWGRLYDGTRIAVSSKVGEDIDKDGKQRLLDAFIQKVGMEFNKRINKKQSGYDFETGTSALSAKIQVGKVKRYFITWQKSGWLYAKRNPKEKDDHSS